MMIPFAVLPSIEVGGLVGLSLRSDLPIEKRVPAWLAQHGRGVARLPEEFRSRDLAPKRAAAVKALISAVERHLNRPA